MSTTIEDYILNEKQYEIERLNRLVDHLRTQWAQASCDLDDARRRMEPLQKFYDENERLVRDVKSCEKYVTTEVFENLFDANGELMYRKYEMKGVESWCPEFVTADINGRRECARAVKVVFELQGE